MFYLKNNDMDDLFRKAAEEYPLDPAKAADWESVHAALGKNHPAVENTGDKKKKRRFLFWWLLLIPLSGLTYYFLSYGAGLHLNREGNKSNGTVMAAEKTSSIGFKTAADNSVNDPGSRNSVKAIKEPAALSSKSNPLSSASAHLGPETHMENGLESANRNKNLPLNKRNTMKLTSNTSRNTDIADYPMVSNEKTGNGNMDEAAGSGPQKVFTASLTGIDRSHEIHMINDSWHRNSLFNQLSRLSADKSTDQKRKTDIRIKKQSFFYTGAYTGADLSFVKSQGTSHAGYNMGILLGYHINKRFGIESGAVLEKKYYYTGGQYFNKSAVPYLRNVDVLSLYGNCNMIDIPVNIRYNFLINKKSTWFATTGMSSYIMTKEYYNYSYEYNGIYGQKGYTYRNSSRNWFSVINLSLGYEHELGKTFMWRIEPYFKLPASGVGLGKLALSSTGLYIGLSRRIH